MEGIVQALRKDKTFKANVLEFSKEEKYWEGRGGTSVPAGGGAGAGRSAVAARLSWREDVQLAPINPTNQSDARIDTDSGTWEL